MANEKNAEYAGGESKGCACGTPGDLLAAGIGAGVEYLGSPVETKVFGDSAPVAPSNLNLVDGGRPRA